MRRTAMDPVTTALLFAGALTFAWLLGRYPPSHGGETESYRAGYEWGEENAIDVDDCTPHPLEFERGCLAAVNVETQEYAGD